MATPANTLPPRQACIGLLIALVLVATPLFFFLPLWVSAGFAASVLWTIRRLRRHLEAVPGAVRVLLTVLAAATVYAAFGTILGRDAGVSLFLLLTGLKLLELRSYRDAMVLLYLGYFLVITGFLFSQELLMALQLVIAAVVLVTVQIALHRSSDRLPWSQLARDAGRLLLQAVPLVLVLFVLFPRLDGPLWGLPKDSYSGMTGLDDSMTPGDISKLAQSDAVAFRVRFDQQIPDISQLYWRGPVLGRFDGRTWSFRTAPRMPPPELDEHGDEVGYTMTMEPHNRHWLLALETAAAEQEIGRLSPDAELILDDPLRERRQYHLTSYLQASWFGLDPIDEQQTRLLPGDGDPASRELGRSWAGLEPRQRIQKALALFRDEPFRYTLEPPLLGANGIDQFLFDSRQGFCEHYAGAFTFLMRAAGLPARVVTGYQGGELNPVGNYLIVRQLNAHAWAEVWLDDVGWTRVDPTAVIPPSRIDLPADNLIGRAGLGGELDAPDFIQRGLRALRRGLDALDNRWNEWVLAYGGDQQQRFLDALGLGRLSTRDLGLAIVASIVVCLLAITGWMFWRRQPLDPVIHSYQRYCTRLARHGLTRRPSEGPWDYYQRVAEQHPAWAEQARLITSLYSRLRYGDDHDPKHVRHLRRLVHNFRPR